MRQTGSMRLQQAVVGRPGEQFQRAPKAGERHEQHGGKVLAGLQVRLRTKVAIGIAVNLKLAEEVTLAALPGVWVDLAPSKCRLAGLRSEPCLLEELTRCSLGGRFAGSTMPAGSSTTQESTGGRYNTTNTIAGSRPRLRTSATQSTASSGRTPDHLPHHLTLLSASRRLIPHLASFQPALVTGRRWPELPHPARPLLQQLLQRATVAGPGDLQAPRSLGRPGGAESCSGGGGRPAPPCRRSRHLSSPRSPAVQHANVWHGSGGC
mmetsp:Transcript_56124/g.176153  ORF Transcript_56124/g.176153 Transcript_56124/m.176153 type:complete len:265 (-) Transcript_56124:104-898(-)